MTKGKYIRTKEFRQQMSLIRKGQTPWNKEKKNCYSKETLKNMSESHKKIPFHKHPAWKGGRMNHRGYILVKMPNHPFCNNNGYIREHRLIVEQQIDRYLLPKETPHHLGTKDDNRPHMLMAFSSHSAHLRFHKNPNNVKAFEIIFDGRKLLSGNPGC